MPTPPGGSEWLIILLIFVLLFGAKKLPELSRSLGQSISSFKKGVREAHEEPEEAETTEKSETGGTAEAVDGSEADVGANDVSGSKSRDRDNV